MAEHGFVTTVLRPKKKPAPVKVIVKGKNNKK